MSENKQEEAKSNDNSMGKIVVFLGLMYWVHQHPAQVREGGKVLLAFGFVALILWIVGSSSGSKSSKKK